MIPLDVAYEAIKKCDHAPTGMACLECIQKAAELGQAVIQEQYEKLQAIHQVLDHEFCEV